MNIENQWKVNRLVDKFADDLKLMHGGKIHAPIRKVVEGKNQAERIYALEYLLSAIVDSQKSAEEFRATLN